MASDGVTGPPRARRQDDQPIDVWPVPMLGSWPPSVRRMPAGGRHGRPAPDTPRPGGMGAWPTRIDRSRRRSRFLVTAFPTCRLMANATSRPDQVLCLTKATDSGPARPRSRVRRSASKVCRDRTAPSGVPPGPEGLTAITPTGDDVPSPGATGSPPGRPWSTSACGSHVSSPACARWVDRFVSSIHFLPLPEPSTWRRVRQGARSHRDQGIPLHARRESTPALVEPREARSVVTVVPFRATQATNGGRGRTRCTTSLARRTTQDNKTERRPTPNPDGAHSPIGARPQLWISLWTDRAVQGRRPT